MRITHLRIRHSLGDIDPIGTIGVVERVVPRGDVHAVVLGGPETLIDTDERVDKGFETNTVFRGRCPSHLCFVEMEGPKAVVVVVE